MPRSWPEGVEIVDTPGTGSVYAHNTAAADGVLPTMDAAIFVLTADPPVSASERDLLGRVHGLSVTTFVVLNKADYTDAAGLAEAVGFTERIAGQAVGPPVRVYPVSARAALAAAATGIRRVRRRLRRVPRRRGAADLRRSAAGRLRRLAGSWIDEIVLARRAAGWAARTRPRGWRRSRPAGRGRPSAAPRRGPGGRGVGADARRAERGGGARPPGSTGGLHTTIGAARRRACRRPGRRDRAAGPGPAGRAGLDGAEAWRQEQAREAGGRASPGWTAGSPATWPPSLARSARQPAELLGLELAAPGPEERLAPDRRFFYSVTENVDQAELLAGAVRRRVPGKLGRRLARDHVLGEAGDLAERQIGRARADLQHRLAEATRQLVLAVSRRYSGSADRLARALRTAATLREQTAGQAAGHAGRAGRRERALRGVLARLEQLHGGSDGRITADG